MPRKHTQPKRAIAIASPTTEKAERLASMEFQKWVAKFKSLKLSDLNNAERATVAVALSIDERAAGACPFENFFIDLLHEVMWGRRPSPDFVEEKLKEFRSSWESEIEHVRDFVAAYPGCYSGAETMEQSYLETFLKGAA